MLHWLLTGFALTAGYPALAGPGTAPGSQEAAPAQGRVIRYGLYRAVKSGRTVADPNSGTGQLVRRPTLEHLEQTDRIPLRLGVYFAYQYRIPVQTERPWADFERVLRHPPMHLPDGSVSTGSTRVIRKRVSAGEVFGLDGYTLSEAYEQVAGDWQFQLWKDGRLQVEQRFTLHPPE